MNIDKRYGFNDKSINELNVQHKLFLITGASTKKGRYSIRLPISARMYHFTYHETVNHIYKNYHNFQYHDLSTCKFSFADELVRDIFSHC